MMRAPKSLKYQFLILLLVLFTAVGLYQGAIQIWGRDISVPITDVFGTSTGVYVIVLCLLSYLLRGQRWLIWVKSQQVHTTWLSGMRVYLSAYTFTPTPGNFGEVVRGILIKPRPLEFKNSLAIFAAERLLDLFALLVLALPALHFIWPVLANDGYWLFAMVCFVVVGYVIIKNLHRLPIHKLPTWIKTKIDLEVTRQCLSHQSFLTLSLSIIAWLCQGVVVMLLCNAEGLSLTLIQASSVYALSMVVGAISAIPAGLVSTEASLTGLLILSGVSAGLALALTLQIRLVTLWLAVAIGFVCLLLQFSLNRQSPLLIND